MDVDPRDGTGDDEPLDLRRVFEDGVGPEHLVVECRHVRLVLSGQAVRVAPSEQLWAVSSSCRGESRYAGSKMPELVVIDALNAWTCTEGWRLSSGVKAD